MTEWLDFTTFSFIYVVVYIGLSQSLVHSTLSLLGIHLFYASVYLFISVNKFIYTIILDSTHMHSYTIFVSLFWTFSVGLVSIDYIFVNYRSHFLFLHKSWNFYFLLFIAWKVLSLLSSAVFFQVGFIFYSALLRDSRQL